MLTPMVATLLVDKVAKRIVQLILVLVMDVHWVIDVIPSERGHYHAVDQSELSDRHGVDGTVPTSALPLLKDSPRVLVTVTQRAPIKRPDHAISGSKILGDALDGQE